MSDERRIVLCIQYWAGDREQAMRNIRRIVDNELTFRNDFEICFVARFDCPHDESTIEYARRKFKVSTYTGFRRGTGWPYGCNDLVYDLFQEGYRRVKSGEWAQVRALFLMEADCVPVNVDWLNRLTQEWSATEREGKWLTGWYWEHPQPHGHINGNLLIHPNIFHYLPAVVGGPANIAWDAYLAPIFKPHWRPASFLENLYKQVNIPRETLQRIADSGVVLIHGVKDACVEEFAATILRKV